MIKSIIYINALQELGKVTENLINYLILKSLTKYIYSNWYQNSNITNERINVGLKLIR